MWTVHGIVCFLPFLSMSLFCTVCTTFRARSTHVHIDSVVLQNVVIGDQIIPMEESDQQTIITVLAAIYLVLDMTMSISTLYLFVSRLFLVRPLSLSLSRSPDLRTVHLCAVDDSLSGFGRSQGTLHV